VRTTTAAWPGQDQGVPAEDTDVTGQSEAVGAPGGPTWSQNVQAFPPTPPAAVEPIFTPLPATPTPYVTDEPAVPVDAMNRVPTNEDDAISFYVYGDAINRDPTESVEPAQFEPQPIIIEQETETQVVQEGESGIEDLPRSGRSRPKPASRKTGGRADATKDTSEPLQE
jgi:hypothetical protein